MQEEMTKDEKKKQILISVKEMIEHYEKLPPHAKVLPVTHYDHLSLLILISTLLELDCS